MLVGRLASCLGVGVDVFYVAAAFAGFNLDVAAADVLHSSSTGLPELVQSFKSLGALRIDLQDVIEGSCSFIIFLKGFVDSPKTKMGVNVGIVQIDGILIVSYCLLVLLKVIQS